MMQSLLWTDGHNHRTDQLKWRATLIRTVGAGNKLLVPFDLSHFWRWRWRSPIISYANICATLVSHEDVRFCTMGRLLRSCYRYGAPSRTTIRILSFGTMAWREDDAGQYHQPKEDDKRWQKLYQLWNQPQRSYTKIVESIGLHPQTPCLLWPSLLVHIASAFVSHPFFFTASLPQISFHLWPSSSVYIALVYFLSVPLCSIVL